ncbi:hypothetical protein KPN_03282 [Klebsiella pneumoniae subsp. pneumoniae MGH 78578]|uniref:Uncharacterized protein n=1 Tax=Klebsiella pneumoniae subsp. pneumoniae (strain ATCC 700721 / MGH 78578) TaxID=272620 RepID=A6TDK9_KLEP7|nr:hypothetical protein KPN_03282 [Klebsiella pneumoniae subsp. pneumoniae MGH 78578]
MILSSLQGKLVSEVCTAKYLDIKTSEH